ncbi:tyrosine-type recombinase/integrase [Membranicola marinus]|uniref:Tyrosine-type recombinase/integrase n=1 Tax=Membranihabitans marinus TaxID=1227546 RepID=A0A953L6G8_9BACT|nr:tyrosine-type recombinase/integrase [Membranihabitans marinus]MBY5957627.1 tyrosine-type recombinase/integrase [Membranihabitans marinus]
MTAEWKIDEFVSYLRFEKRYSLHTLTAYQCDLKQFKDYMLDQYQLLCSTEVKLMHVRSWVYDMTERKLKKQSINRKLSTLRSYFQFLKREGHVETNPVAQIQPMKTGKQLPEVIPEAVIKMYLQGGGQDHWKDIRDRILIAILYETGMRRAELMNLEWKDIDLRSGYIVIMGKRQKQRQIPVRPELLQSLKQYRMSTMDEFNRLPYPVMVTDQGEKVYAKWIYNKVKSILGGWSSSQRLSPHLLRHSIATHLLNAGADIQVIREFLGHSTLAATEIYTHNSIEKLKKTYQNALPDLDAVID